MHQNCLLLNMCFYCWDNKSNTWTSLKKTNFSKIPHTVIIIQLLCESYYNFKRIIQFLEKLKQTSNLFLSMVNYQIFMYRQKCISTCYFLLFLLTFIPNIRKKYMYFQIYLNSIFHQDTELWNSKHFSKVNNDSNAIWNREISIVESTWLSFSSY